MYKTLSSDVLKVLDRSSKIIGRWKEDDFHVNNWSYFQDNPVDSPIEQILFIAFRLIQELAGEVPAEPASFNGKDDSIIIGLGIHPQRTIGKYRVDFMACYGRVIRGIHEYEEVIIECDSQQFHERTEKERRYEKCRDRFLQKEGYKVFRYTGKEIIEHPYKIAAEIIGHLTHTLPEELLLILEEWL